MTHQYEVGKLNLRKGDIFMIIDFVQNYVHKGQNEIHSAHWTQKQTTVHPIVVYYKCLEESCKKNVKEEEVMCLSGDKT